MCMDTTSVGNLFGNVQIPHNCNTVKVYEFVLLLFLKILLSAGTTVEPIVVMEDSATDEHSTLLEHTVDVAEPSPFYYTMVEVRTVDVAQTEVMVVMV